MKNGLNIENFVFTTLTLINKKYVFQICLWLNNNKRNKQKVNKVVI